MPSRVVLERRQRTLAGAIVAAAILVAVVLWVALRHEPSPKTDPDPAEAAAHVEALPDGARARGTNEVARGDVNRLVRLDLSVRPAHAALSIDGRRLSSNPLRATMVWDPHEHTVRGEADGYEPFTATFRLDADVTIDAVLRPKPSGAVKRSNTSYDERVVLRQTGELHARHRP